MTLPHNLRLRPDLIIQPQDPVSGTWVVKDPVSLRFFLFGGDERFIMDRLDGRRTMEQIIDDFTSERAPKRMTLERLQAFLAALHRNGLASSDAPRQGQIMLERESEHVWRQNALGWTNLLAIRLPGFNPKEVLDRVYSWVRWCFSWWFIACAIMLWITAVGVVITDWGTFRLAWPRLQEFVSGPNLVWLAVAFMATKCLHELAHALTCKHFGGRCHEVGVILLVFMPCLYCNVTDAWMLRSRWQRIAISAAGMAVELLLAALAVLLWRYSQPGVLNSICLNMIVVCGVGTLLFNGNPLLKLDGYYILSDLTRMPNLWQESRAFLYRQVTSWFCSSPVRHDVAPGHAWLLITYALASTVYRICLTVGILLFMYRALHPKGMDLIVVVISVGIALQTAIAWSMPILRWWNDPTKWKNLNKWVPPAAGIIAAAVFAAAWLISFPCSVTAPAVMQPSGAVKVFVSSPGVLTQAVAAGARVKKGETLALLRNAELTNERLVAASELIRSQARVRTLQLRLNDETEAAAQLAVAQEICEDLTQQARLRDDEFSRLTITAPVAGTVLLSPAVSAKLNETQLPNWIGSPLDRENRGCYLERGTLLCLVGDSQKFEAIALVDETDVPYVKAGQRVRLQVEHLTDIMTGRVTEVGEVNVEVAPAELVSQHEIAVRDIKGKGLNPIRKLYQARVEIDTSDMPLLTGSRGAVRIKVAPKTIAQQLMHWARHTFSANPGP